MKLSDVEKITIIYLHDIECWNAWVEKGPWGMDTTPEKALARLMKLLQPKKSTRRQGTNKPAKP
jgi:hypothetical protein